MTQRTLTGIIALLALIAGIAGALYIAPPSGESRVPEYFQAYPQPKPLDDFSLTDADGQPFTRENLTGAWTLVFLGYTYCPDVCPTTMASLNKIWPKLSSIKSGANTQVLFLSVDPKRDTFSKA